MLVEIAALKIVNAGKMSRQLRKDVAAWLSRQARLLVVDGDRLATRYRARYFACSNDGKVRRSSEA
jgi:hypothetical protein